MTDSDAQQNGPAKNDAERPDGGPARPSPHREPDTVRIPASMALTPEAELLSTDELEAIEAKKAAAEPEPLAIVKWWNRFDHIYRTHVRTTTVLLIVLFVVGLVMYGCTTSYYGEAPTPPGNTRPIERTSEPPSRQPSHEPSIETSEPSESPSTEQSESPSTTTSSHWLDRLPGRGGTQTTPSPTPRNETESPTESVPTQ